MFKLFCVTGYKINKNDPIIIGRQTRQMILEESKDVLTADVERLMAAIKRLQGVHTYTQGKFERHLDSIGV